MANDEVGSQAWTEKIEELVRRAEAIPDPIARAVAVDLLQAVLEFHAAGLQRMLEIIAASGTAGQAFIERIAADDLAGSMLLLHELHPDDLETRIDRALDKLRPMFASLGAHLSLSAIESGTVRLQFESARTWSGAPVRKSIEDAIFQAAPEIENVLVEGLKEAPSNGFIPVSELLAGAHS